MGTLGFGDTIDSVMSQLCEDQEFYDYEKEDHEDFIDVNTLEELDKIFDKYKELAEERPIRKNPYGGPTQKYIYEIIEVNDDLNQTGSTYIEINHFD
jgi:hypothetical protein